MKRRRLSKLGEAWRADSAGSGMMHALAGLCGCKVEPGGRPGEPYLQVVYVLVSEAVAIQGGRPDLQASGQAGRRDKGTD